MESVWNRSPDSSPDPSQHPSHDLATGKKDNNAVNDSGMGEVSCVSGKQYVALPRELILPFSSHEVSGIDEDGSGAV
jgi:hypothetical protein